MAPEYPRDDVASDDLPFIDEHAIRIDAPRERVFAGLERHVDRSLAKAGATPLTRVLGTDPPGGFGVEHREPPDRLHLAGRHRFSRYALRFELTDAPGGATELRARTLAAFPGIHGRVYKALVVDSRMHVIATRGLLRAIRRGV